MKPTVNSVNGKEHSKGENQTGLFSQIRSLFSAKKSNYTSENKMDYFHQHVYPFSIERKVQALQRRAKQK